jgi:glutamyl-tRNA reductase
MNLLVVGVSYRTAGVPMLERLTVASEQLAPLLDRLLAQEYLGEALVLSTCNRVEVYAAVTAFHGGLSDIGAVLAGRAGRPVNELAPHMYVHYDVDAVRHAFRVAAGLDSMVVGEAQILGQLRDAYSAAAGQGATGRLLHELMQQALRVGKRAHSETGVDGAGQSVVTAALGFGLARFAGAGAVGVGAAGTGGGQAVGEFAGLAGRPALVIGAGSMGALTLSTLRRAGAGPLFIANRGIERAGRLAAGYGATVVALDELDAILSTVDIVVCATAAPEPVLTADMVAAARRPLLVVDLAVPRNVASDVADLPGVVLVDLERLRVSNTGDGSNTRDGSNTGDGSGASVGTGLGDVAGADWFGGPADSEIRAVNALVAAEVDAYLAWLRSSDVAPTVAALRARADDVISTELRRLGQRRPDLSEEQRADVAQAVHRVVQRLLHQPTVRVRQLAAEPGGAAYALALRELFDLDVAGQIDPVVAAVGEVTAP